MNSIYKKFGKRTLDLLLALCFLFLVSPILLVSIFAVYFSLGRPIFFRQKRIGINGKPFTILKLRTMLETEADDGEKIQDSYRLTRTGKILRSLSLDEIPSILNVMSGSMSLVGPRPLLLDYLPLYDERQFRRHDVRPGITGLAQINGRNSLDWESKFKWDLQYVETLSFTLDLRIIFKTVRIVLLRRGIFHKDSITMPPFRGNKF
jgi:lipopolysaccharide/colanic/teichoic acid biosynthesis glycosyltransferase